MAEDDLILGDQRDEDELFVTQQEIRENIDTCIYVYQFLDEIDLENPDILRWKMTNKLRKTKKSCLQLIIDSMEMLQYEQPKEENQDSDGQ